MPLWTEPQTSPAIATGRGLFDKHRETLRDAGLATGGRGYWSAYDESPRAYGAEAAAAGQEAFEKLVGQRFELDQPGVIDWVGTEASPYGMPLAITYPRCDPDTLIASMVQAMPAWRDAGPEARVGVCLEIIARLNARSHEIAHSVMHTTGQAFAMAFQAGGPHAQDRALEAVGLAHEAMTRFAGSAIWEKPQGNRPPLRLAKKYRAVPKGVSLVIGCSTFPTWNSYPGLFASLATGNPVIVKPSSRAILPLAITVRLAREVLRESGFSPNLITLAVESKGDRIGARLAQRDEVRIIDYTGGTEFGVWLERNAHQAVVFTEKSGVNSVIVDSTDDYAGMLANLAFTLSLYSGQMCTTPQNILVPGGGFATDQGHKSFDAFAADLADAIDRLLSDEARAVAVLGAISSPDILDRVRAAGHGEVARPSQTIVHPEFPGAAVQTPLLLKVNDVDSSSAHLMEQFGPISYIISTADTAASLDLWDQLVRTRGSITAGIYSTSEEVLHCTEDLAVSAGVSLSCNLTGGIYVNQSAAFSDFHATGLNPSANAALCDAAFVAPRFHVVWSRRPAPAEPAS
jgi:phenylacetic acid degradation protein paaN